MRYPLALTLLLVLAACGRERPEVVQVVAPPKVVRVAVKELVGVPAELAADCDDEPPKEQTYAEAKRLAIVRGAYLTECTSRMRKIRALPAKP